MADSQTKPRVVPDNVRNIITFMTDQHRIDTLGCMGNTHAQTPNIDSLAADDARGACNALGEGTKLEFAADSADGAIEHHALESVEQRAQCDDERKGRGISFGLSGPWRQNPL